MVDCWYASCIDQGVFTCSISVASVVVLSISVVRSGLLGLVDSLLLVFILVMVLLILVSFIVVEGRVALDRVATVLFET